MNPVDVHTDNIGGVAVINATDVGEGEIRGALSRSTHEWARPIVDALTKWTSNAQGISWRGRVGNYYERDRYLCPIRTFDQIRTARLAMHDDVVEGVADTTEAVLFKTMSVFSTDEDQQDIWNQWIDEDQVDLATRFREGWRQLYTDSQVVFGMLWGRRSYTVRGATESGRPRRKPFLNLRVPTAMTVFDTTKVVPVGTTLFERERLAYVADDGEDDTFSRMLRLRDQRAMRFSGVVPSDNGPPAGDDLVEALIERPYAPNEIEREELMEEGISPDRLYLLRPGSAFRHCLTKPGYQRFADVRMRSIFEVLDIKYQLRQLDRTWVIGGINFILLIRIGSDLKPATGAELDGLDAMAVSIAKLPVVVGDHRLTIDILVPKVELVIDADKWDTLDERIRGRVLQQFLPSTSSQGVDPVKMSKVVADGLESRRMDLRRRIERKVFGAIRAANPELSAPANIEFWPDQISLAFDSDYASFLLDLRQAMELSRGTILGQFGFDQHREFIRRQREEATYDDTFGTIVPFGGGGSDDGGDGGGGDTSNMSKRSAGRTGGGRRNGGGAAPGSGQGRAPRNPRKKSD